MLFGCLYINVSSHLQCQMKVIEQEDLQELALVQTVEKNVFSLEIPSAE